MASDHFGTSVPTRHAAPGTTRTPPNTASPTGRRPVCDIENGHRSTNMSLLGMLSWKLGRSVRWDGEKEEVIDDPEANKLLCRAYRAPWEYPEG